MSVQSSRRQSSVTVESGVTSRLPGSDSERKAGGSEKGAKGKKLTKKEIED